MGNVTVSVLNMEEVCVWQFIKDEVSEGRVIMNNNEVGSVQQSNDERFMTGSYARVLGQIMIKKSLISGQFRFVQQAWTTLVVL